MIEKDLNQGFWEQKGHNPLVASLIFILVLGGIYFLLQSLILNGYILIDMALRKDRILHGDFFERTKELYRIYQRPILIIIMATQFLLLLLPTILFYRRQHFKDWWNHFNLNGLTPVALLVSIGGTLLFLPLAEVLSSFFYHFFPGLAQWSELQIPLFEAEGSGELFLLLLVIGLTPALCEEMLFRGYLQTQLQRKLKGFPIILISGVIFGLYHQNATGLIALSAAGIWLGLLSWKFKSLFASITAHLVYNGTIILITNKMIPQPLVTEEGTFPLPVTLIACLLFALLTWWIWKYGEKYAKKTTN